MRYCALLSIALLLAAPAAAEEKSEDPLVAALKNPQATGLLVVSVTPKSEAHKAGVLRGDVIVTYDGKATPSVETLSRAKQVAISKLEVVMEVVRSSGKREALSLKPGQIGVRLVPVTKGKPVAPLPKSTGVKFDFTSLAKAPWDYWYVFLLDGKRKAGFEHVLLALEDGKLELRQEVAFDGGQRWGLNHVDVKVVVSAQAMPALVKTTFKSPRTGWLALGRVTEFEDGTRDWTTTVRPKGEEPKVSARPVPKDCVPEYLVPHLAAFMPRQKDACFHFLPLTESTGEAGLPSALLALGEEEIEHGGAMVMAWKYEQRRLGGGAVVGTYWVGPTGRVLLLDYGGARARLATKEKALQDLHPNIEPQTAD